jgi:hypothetical protein
VSAVFKEQASRKRTLASRVLLAWLVLEDGHGCLIDVRKQFAVPTQTPAITAVAGYTQDGQLTIHQ